MILVTVKVLPRLYLFSGIFTIFIIIHGRKYWSSSFVYNIHHC